MTSYMKFLGKIVTDTCIGVLVEDPLSVLVKETIVGRTDRVFVVVVTDRVTVSCVSLVLTEMSTITGLETLVTSVSHDLPTKQCQKSPYPKPLKESKNITIFSMEETYVLTIVWT